MHVERLLQINMATLVVMSTFLVGMGQQDSVFPVAMLVLATLSVWLTDVAGKFHLPRTVAKIAMLATLAFTLVSSIRPERILVIAAIGRFLMFLQLIHLFQKKDLQVYRSLLALSVIQAVVAALLNQGLLFGALLVLYLFTSLSALFLLFLHGERLVYAADEQPLPRRNGSRWPLAGQKAVFAAPIGGRIPIEAEMFFRLFRMGLFVLAVSVVVFLTVPRFGHGAWKGLRGGRASVGFTNNVTLGDMGKVIQNPEEVLKIWFTRDGQPYPVQGEVYLRGAVLSEYNDGHWQARSSVPSRTDFMRLPRIGSLIDEIAPGDSRERAVQQEILIQPSGVDELFCVWPFVQPQPRDTRIAYDARMERLVRQRAPTQGAERFVLETTAFAAGMQRALVPCDHPVQRDVLLQIPTERGQITLPQLAALAEEWVAPYPVARDDAYECAQLLERQLRDSGEFSYSLEGADRNLQIDRLEDFVTEHRSGHCEYFASALVMMLRSRGVPARLVVGYKTDERNDLGNPPFYVVRQLHAHAWVEAYLEPDELPEEVREPQGMSLAETLQRRHQWRYGGWITLDPTPGRDLSSAESFWIRGPGRYFNWLDFAWTQYILDMDRSRQWSSIYAPLSDSLRDIKEAIFNPEWWRGILGSIRNGVSNWHAPGFSWGAFLAIVCGGAVFVGTLAISPWAWRRWLAAGPQKRRALRKGARVRVEFFRRLETALARTGVVRGAAQTQRELAAAGGRRLAEQLGEEELAALALEVAEAFYRVRFGHDVLDKPHAEAVEQALARLERASHRLKAGMVRKARPAEGSPAAPPEAGKGRTK
jgi:transglutaminase-like putative cysteine protease